MPAQGVHLKLSELGSTRGAPDIEQVVRIFDHLCRVAPRLKRSHRVSKVFSRVVFNPLVAAATQQAVGLGLIKP